MKTSIHFKTILVLSLFALLCFSFARVIQAAPKPEEGVTPEIEEEIKPPQAVAGEDQNVKVGQEIWFDGSKSQNPLEGEMKYTWNFGDGQVVEGQKVTHAYTRVGSYKVVLTVDNGQAKAKDELKVTVWEHSVILITDKTPTQEEVDSLRRYAVREGMLLEIISDLIDEADYIKEEKLTGSLLEKRDLIRESSIIICWTSGNLGLNVLSKFAREAENIEELDITSKVVINIVDGRFGPVARIAQSTFDVLKPQYILLTRQAALYPVIDAKTSEKVLSQVRGSGIDYQLIGIYSIRAVKELGPTNFMSYAVNYLVNKGISARDIVLILMLPVIATIIVLFRQILGIKTLGIYIPSILTLAFLAVGLKYGLAVFFVVLVTATVVRWILKRARLLYLPRMAIVLTIVALAILFTFILGARFGKTGFISMSILPMLAMILLVERFVAVQIERGGRQALGLSLATIVVSCVCFWIVNLEYLKTLILGYPEIILVTLPLNILLGRWTGLRLTEYFRFLEIRRLIKTRK